MSCRLQEFKRKNCLKLIIVLATLCLLVGVTTPRPATALLSMEDLKGYHEQILKTQYAKSLFEKAQKLKGRWVGQCVVAARNFLGLTRTEIGGIARNFKIDQTEPEIGSVVKLKMSRYGHVGVVLAIENDIITYFDGNGDLRERGAIRKININDKRILGYKNFNN